MSDVKLPDEIFMCLNTDGELFNYGHPNDLVRTYRYVRLDREPCAANSTAAMQAFRAAFDFALDDLLARLEDAQACLGGGQDSAAIGTLVDLDVRVADLQAALRLFIHSKRRLA